MELKQLKYFVVVADCGSINKAAEELFTAQSNVSKVIKAFEKKIKIELFTRNSKGVRLTDKGCEIYDYAKRVLKNIDIMESISWEESRNKLNISCYQNHIISKVLCNYYNEYKDKNIQVQFLEGNAEQIVDNVKNSLSEFGIVYILNNQKCCFNHNLNHKNLEFEVLDCKKPCIYVGKNNPIYERNSITLKDILNLKFIQSTRDFFSLEQYLEKLHLSKKPLYNAITTDSNYMITNLLKDTDLCKFSMEIENNEYKSLNIKAIDIVGCTEDVFIGYVKRKGEDLSKEAINFINILKNEICK